MSVENEYHLALLNQDGRPLVDDETDTDSIAQAWNRLLNAAIGVDVTHVNVGGLPMLVRLLKSTPMGLSYAGILKATTDRFPPEMLLPTIADGEKAGAISFYMSDDDPPVKVYTDSKGRPS